MASLGCVRGGEAQWGWVATRQSAVMVKGSPSNRAAVVGPLIADAIFVWISVGCLEFATGGGLRSGLVGASVVGTAVLRGSAVCCISFWILEAGWNSRRRGSFGFVCAGREAEIFVNPLPWGQNPRLERTSPACIQLSSFRRLSWRPLKDRRVLCHIFRSRSLEYGKRGR